MVWVCRIAYPAAESSASDRVQVLPTGPTVKDSRIKSVLGALVVSIGCIGASNAAQPAPAPADHGDVADWALLGKYCTECHNAEDWAGGIAFDTMTEGEISDNIDVLEKTVRKLRSQLMPPGGHKMPDKNTRSQFIGWLEGRLDEAGEKHEDPGHVGLHRLNRTEYANAVRDLLGLEIDPGDCCRRTTPRTASTTSPRCCRSRRRSSTSTWPRRAPWPCRPWATRMRGPPARTYRRRALGTADRRTRRPAARHARRHRRRSHLPRRRRVRAQHRRHGAGPVGRRTWSSRTRWSSRSTASVVYETTIGGEEDMKAIDQKQDPAGRCHQRAPEEHPLPGEGRRSIASWSRSARAASPSPMTGCSCSRPAAARTAC